MNVGNQPTDLQLLTTVTQAGRFQVFSLHVDAVTANDLDRLGITTGALVDVLHNDFRGTIALRSRGNRLVILGRACSYKIKVIPRPEKKKPRHCSIKNLKLRPVLEE